MDDEVGIIKVTATGRINNDIAIVTDSNIRFILYYGPYDFSSLSNKIS